MLSSIFQTFKEKKTVGRYQLSAIIGTRFSTLKIEYTCGKPVGQWKHTSRSWRPRLKEMPSFLCGAPSPHRNGLFGSPESKTKKKSATKTATTTIKIGSVFMSRIKGNSFFQALWQDLLLKSHQEASRGFFTLRFSYRIMWQTINNTVLNIQSKM